MDKETYYEMIEEDMEFESSGSCWFCGCVTAVDDMCQDCFEYFQQDGDESQVRQDWFDEFGDVWI